MAPKTTEEERLDIVVLLREHNGNRSKVANLTNRSKGLISKIAGEEGIESVNVHATKKATEASQALRKIDRLDIIGLGLETGAQLLRQYEGREPTLENIRAYKDLMTGLAIGIDKHRLETGEATSRGESTHRHKSYDMTQIADEELEEFERILYRD